MNDVSAANMPQRTLTPMVIGCLGATWIIWGSTYLVIRFALVGFSPFFLMATRFLAAGAFLMSLQLVRGRPMPTLRQWGNAIIVGTLMLCGGMGSVAFAEQTVASGIVVAFIAVMPLLLIVVNRIFGVRPERSELTAVCVGFIGVLMLTRGAGLHGSPAGLTAIAIGTTGWALGSVLSQRSFALAPGPTGYGSEMLCGGLALLAASAIAGEPWHIPTQPAVWASWTYLVVFGTLIGFSSYMVLLARTAMSLAASYSLVNPVVALLLGVTVGGEIVTQWEWSAAGVVLLGVVILFAGRRR